MGKRLAAMNKDPVSPFKITSNYFYFKYAEISVKVPTNYSYSKAEDTKCWPTILFRCTNET